MSRLTAFSGNSRNLALQVARALSNRHTFSTLRNSNKINAISATNGVVQTRQTQFYSTNNNGELLGDREEKSSDKMSNTNIDTKFSLQVAKRALQQGLITNNQKNLMCSPTSIDALLNTIALGAKGKMQTQFRKLLGYDNIKDLKASAAQLSDVFKQSEGANAPEIACANAMWLDKQFSLNSSFQKSLKSLHNVEVNPSDFSQPKEVANEVNAWAEDKTKGFIKHVLTPNSIDRDTTMLLTNALYFKGTWDDQFDNNNTRDNNFCLLNGDKIQAPFMNKTGGYFKYGKFEGYNILRLPYKQGSFAKGEKQRIFSMYIFLPQEKDGLVNLMNNIKIDTNTFWDNLELSSQKIASVSIPKFKFECDVDATEHMKELGLTLPFDRNCKDLMGIIDDLNNHQNGDWLYVKDILQKCRIETNETGTEAACVSFGVHRFGGRWPHFVADHPFMFMIREDVSGEILFAGTLLNPKNE